MSQSAVEDVIRCQEFESNDISNDDTGLGFFGATPAAQPSSYTQTFSTADRTHAARSANSLTDNTGSTNTDDTVAAVSGSGADTTINDNFSDLANEINDLRTDQRDTAELVNQILDDLQTLGLLQ